MSTEAEAYDAFCDYVRDKMRDRDNPQLALREFDLRQPAGVTHALFDLENVRVGSEKLFERVKQFRPGAKLQTREDTNTGNMIYVAHIPYGKRHNKSKHHHSSHKRISPPNPHLLFLYIFLLMCLALFASLKTSGAEWRYIFGSRS